MVKKVGLIGHNINYSISPLLHNYWLNNLNIAAFYHKIDINKETLATISLLELFQQGYIGFNITIPYKEKILSLIKKHDITVKKIKACNTLYLKEGNLVAYNTDFFGFLIPLLLDTYNIDSLNIENLNNTIKKTLLAVKNKKKMIYLFKPNNNVLIIGAGGAARAVVYALLKTNVTTIFVINRNIIKANLLKTDFNDTRLIIVNDLKKISQISLIVNCTPLQNENPFDFNYKNLLTKNCLFYDLIYNPKETNFLLQAKKLGFKTLNGLLMLILQGAISFEKWFNILPKIDKNLINIVNSNIK